MYNPFRVGAGGGEVTKGTLLRRDPGLSAATPSGFRAVARWAFCLMSELAYEVLQTGDLTESHYHDPTNKLQLMCVDAVDGESVG